MQSKTLFLKTLSLQTAGLIGSTRNIWFYQRVFDVAHEQKLARVIPKRAEMILDLITLGTHAQRVTVLGLCYGVFNPIHGVRIRCNDGKIADSVRTQGVSPRSARSSR